MTTRVINHITLGVFLQPQESKKAQPFSLVCDFGLKNGGAVSLFIVPIIIKNACDTFSSNQRSLRPSLDQGLGGALGFEQTRRGVGGLDLRRDPPH